MVARAQKVPVGQNQIHLRTDPSERENMVNGVALIAPAGRFSEFVPSPRIVADFCGIVGIRKALCAQLLQNAARYRSAQPVVTLSARALGRRVELTVEDNGIGIPAHELPRIFDRGFTGSNGRSRGGSTGMGLYLARRLATALEIELRAASEEGKGTRMTLLFPARENLSKL